MKRERELKRTGKENIVGRQRIDSIKKAGHRSGQD